jgi:L-lactate dehydrogenase complex protein LldG
MSDSRNQILERIRGSLGAVANGMHGQAPTDRQRELEAIPRRYIREGKLDADRRVELFEERVRDYDATVCRVSHDGISVAVAERLRARSKNLLAVPAALSPNWLPDGFTFVPANNLPLMKLDGFDGVITACTVAIALTGSIVLQNAPGQGPRRLSLVPDYHLCIVFAEQIVETVPQAFDRLAATATLPTTFISGPSATADIEMTRIRGVHGPRTLDVLVVMDN